jgi:hypothetical protein
MIQKQKMCVAQKKITGWFAHPLLRKILNIVIGIILFLSAITNRMLFLKFDSSL